MRAFCLLTRPNVAQTLNSVEGILECHTVSKLADAFLEELNGSLGVNTVMAINFSARETQDVETLLQLTHVIAVEVRKTQVEGSVSELIALIDHDCPGRGIYFFSKRKVVVKPKASNRACS